MTSEERKEARVVGGAISVSDCEIDVGGTERKRGRQRVKFNKEVVKGEKPRSQAVSRPPRVPSAGLKTKVDTKLGGRKVLALKVS